MKIQKSTKCVAGSDFNRKSGVVKRSFKSTATVERDPATQDSATSQCESAKHNHITAL